MRIVVAKVGLDGHDRGAKVISRALRDAGHEVIYSGIRKTPLEIVRIIIDEDADALGISTLSGAHDILIPKICEILRNEDLNELIVFAGGIIPERDREAIYNCGVRAIFGPGTNTNSIFNFLNESVRRKENGDFVGVGETLGWHWIDE